MESAQILLRALPNLALDGGNWLASRSGSFIPEEKTLGTHRIEVSLDI
jgi:hypothetical protein